MNIIELNPTYRSSVSTYIRYLWGGPNIVTLGNLYDTSNLPGFIAEGDGAFWGAILYRLNNDECEYSFSLKTVHIGAFEVTRKIKNGPPALGNDNIPIDHEFEFEMLL